LSIELETQQYAPQPTAQEETLFRIAQESLNNIVKHARATRVNLQLAARNGSTCLAIRDNGVGFTLVGENSAQRAGAPSARRGGMGLQTMRERAAALGGTVNILTAPGQGTLVEVIVPGSQGVRRSE
jgi:signal transduction histidine kinase